MAQHRRLFGATVAAASLVTFAAPSAAEPTRRSRVLIAQFGEDAIIPTPSPGEPLLVSRMQDGFGELAASADAPDPAVPATRAFLLSPHPHAPVWMRTGKPGGSPLIATRLAPIGNCEIRLYQPSGIISPQAEERRRLFYPLVQRAACDAGLPVGLMDALLIQESRYNPLARSPKGAFGLGQLMPGTAVQLGVDRYDLRGNLAGAARYLRQHIDEFGQVPLALAAYNAGPGRVRRTWGIPRIAETEKYVREILVNWRAFETAAMLHDGGPAASAASRSARISRFP